jgi:hypothetical protein
VVFCPNCGFENKNSAKFCKNCGTPLITDRPIKDNYVATGNDPTARVDNSNFNSNKNSDSSSDNKNLIIICLTVVICAILIAGALVLFSNNNSNDNSDILSDSASLNGSNAIEVNDTDINNEPKNSAQSSIKILSGSFSTGSGKSDKTYCSVYVGEEYAGENVKISVLYSRDGSTLNQGNIVPKTVDSSGYVSVPSANAFKYYPDDAVITLYDSDGNILDTQEVYLSPESGKQTF